MGAQVFTIAPGVPFAAAAAAWLTQNHAPLHTATVWLPNQQTRAQLTKHLAQLGIRRLPALRLLRAEEPDIAAPAPNVLSPAALAALIAATATDDALAAQTGALTSLFNAQVSLPTEPWLEAGPTARRLRQLFDKTTQALHSSGLETLATAAADTLARAAAQPGPHVVIGVLDAHGPALTLLRTLAQNPANTFIFPNLPLPGADALPSHPGAALAKLLAALNLTPAALQPLPNTPEAPPAATPILLEAPHPLAEAETLALLVRESIAANQTPVHILCPDTAQRRLLAAALRAHHLPFTAEPPCLAQTPAGQAVLALVRAAAQPTAATLSAATQALQLDARLDLLLWRGVAAEGWADWAAKLQTLTADDLPPEQIPALRTALTTLQKLLEPLAAPRPLPRYSADTRTALNLARPGWELEPGGATLSRLLAQWADVPAAPPLSAQSWAALLEQQTAVHPLPAPAPTDETQKIWLTALPEARLLPAATVILAGTNEGTWPATPQNPLLGDAECERLGLPGQRQQVRLTAAEWHLALHAAPRVFISRSQTDATGPTRPSRFLQNLKTESGTAWVQQAQTISVPPAPLAHAGCYTPGPQLLTAAWSPSWVEDLATCPYRALSKRRLHLAEPDTYYADPTAEHHGLWVHRWLAEFWRQWPGPLTAADLPAATQLLQQTGQHELSRQPEIVQHLWRNRLAPLARDIAAHEATRPERTHRAEAKLEAPLGATQLRARADRVDESAQGTWLIDYKTGTPPSWPQVSSGKKPQLLIEALLAQTSGATVAGVEYQHLRGHGRRRVKATSYSGDKLDEPLQQTGPWLQALQARYRPGQTHPAAPVYGGGLEPRDHCKNCPYGGLCRWTEAPAPAAPAEATP